MNIDFCLIGVQKSASTWMHNCLNEHPDIFIGGDKNEENYFGGPLFLERGEKWFWSMYENHKAQKTVGNSSVDYIYDIEATSNLVARFPRIQLLLILRNPIDRAFSAYNWLYRQNLVPEISPGQILNESSKQLFVNDSYTDLQIREILDRGLYFKQLERFADSKILDRVHIVTYDEIKDKPRQTLKSIFTLLGVNENFSPINLHRKPKKSSRIQFLLKLQRKSSSRVINKFFNASNEILGRLNSKSEYSELLVNHEIKQLILNDLQSLRRLIINNDLLINPQSIKFLDKWEKSLKGLKSL